MRLISTLVPRIAGGHASTINVERTRIIPGRSRDASGEWGVVVTRESNSLGQRDAIGNIRYANDDDTVNRWAFVARPAGRTSARVVVGEWKLLGMNGLQRRCGPRETHRN